MVPLRRAALALPLALLALAAGAHASGTPATVALGETPALAPGAAPLGELAPGTPLDLTVVLAPRDPGGLAALARAVSTPGSPEYHRYLGVREFAARFGASPATVAALRAALRARGLRPGSLAPDGLSLPVAADAASASRAFAVSLRRFRERGGRIVFANTTAPRVPSALGRVLAGVLGLDDVPAEVPASLVRAGASARATSAPFTGGSGPSPCAAASALAHSGGPYTIDQVAHAYGLDGLWSQGDLGAGVTVALYELEPYDASDLAAYQSCFGTSTTVTNVAVDGGPGSVGAGSGETVLDLDNVIGIAPQSRIDVYQGPNDGAGIYDTMQAIVDQDVAQVVSDSWGLCEPALTGTSLIADENTLLEQAALQGQTVFVASGDSGSDGCHNGTLAVVDPASQPWVTGVGGTKLTVGGSPEAVWRSGGSSDGGGISSVWPLPSWQASIVNGSSSGTPCGAASGHYCREVPDVSADADPNTGYVAFYGGQWGVYGGTSAAAPLWAGLTALADASPGTSGCGGRVPLGFLNQKLYVIGTGANHAQALFDVTSGDNNLTVPSGPYAAATGYDMASGLGTPIATGSSNALVPQLCAGEGAITVAPSVSALDAADAAPGQTVLIDGAAFTSGATVSFGGTPAGGVALVSYNQLSATVPAGSGVVDVTVHIPGNGTSATSTHDLFTYAPTESITVPANGAMYTQGQQVLASYACAASAPGPLSCSGPAASGSPVDTSSAGPHSFTVSATDSNSATTQQTVSYTVVAPPSTTIAIPANGAAYTEGEALRASYSCAAFAPGSTSCTGNVPNGSPLDTSVPGSHSFTLTATDSNGVSTSQTVTYVVLPGPQVAVSIPATGASYLQHSAVAAVFSCAAAAPAVVARCSGPVGPGAPIDTTSVGAHSFVVTVTDSNGVSSSQTVSYRVIALRPTIAGLAQSAAAWLERKHRGSHLSVGTTFSLTLDQAARVTLTFRRIVSGRREHGRCVAPPAAPQHAPSCSRGIFAGTVTFTAEPGASSHRFAGRTSAGMLPVGSYVVRVSAVGASGRPSTVATLRFAVRSR